MPISLIHQYAMSLNYSCYDLNIWNNEYIYIYDKQVRGVPKPRVTWYKDGEPLVSGKHATGCTEMGKCTLTIASVVDEDAGRYACEAINDQGRVCTLTVVEVMGNRRVVEAERRLQG